MKARINSIILLLTVALYLFPDATVIVVFKINQKAITLNHCINIDKPELGCNGKCQLEKNLTESHENPQEIPTREKTEQRTLPLFVSCLPSHNIQNESLIKITGNTIRTNQPVMKGFDVQIFHPPKG
jgi:hypothetical protein